MASGLALHMAHTNSIPSGVIYLTWLNHQNLKAGNLKCINDT